MQDTAENVTNDVDKRLDCKGLPVHHIWSLQQTGCAQAITE